MEILKNIFNKKILSAEKYMNNEIVAMDLYCSKFYTMKELIYLLKYYNIDHEDYLQKCNNNQISPVHIEDKEIIIDYIENYIIPTNHFDLPKYFGNKNYNFVLELISTSKKGLISKNKKFYIVVPESIRSPLNMANIKQFLLANKLEKTNIEDILQADDTIKINWNNVDFVIFSNINNFTSEDWDNIVCIFSDGEPWQFKKWSKQNLVEIFERIPTFYIHFKNQRKSFLRDYNVKEIIVDEKSLKVDRNYDIKNIIFESVYK